LADPAILMVNRNAGSGTRVLIDSLLRDAKPPGYANQPRSHNSVAAGVAQGRADWGIAIAPIANLYGLLVEARRQRSAVRAFIEVLQDEAIRDRIRALGMEPGM
jgi:molybdopterin molybdotransferase/putative molybdopterin biosynthesis protein